MADLSRETLVPVDRAERLSQVRVPGELRHVAVGPSARELHDRGEPPHRCDAARVWRGPDLDGVDDLDVAFPREEDACQDEVYERSHHLAAPPPEARDADDLEAV